MRSKQHLVDARVRAALELLGYFLDASRHDVWLEKLTGKQEVIIRWVPTLGDCDSRPI